ncbi:MAG: cobalt ECF transporter T component CbiQ [Candidatus Omnitrophica bacterium]|nr:cobalt ECF transporter T component CbiQ [Candidatus Omnitrophota bacterium]MDD5236435.1 cobalt ECF transporter T component CbiQ [Candidatus Omnitrophota bacterium]MDD5611397.1 cobalt ECF transporter T component CbiQ [Candidatus Omnitrophota bacterium]
MSENNFIRRSILSACSFIKESVFSDEYAARSGFLQARDARIKILIIFSLLLAILFSRSIIFLLSMYMLCLSLAVASSINIGFFLKRTWVFIPLFSLFLALPVLFDVFSPGEPWLNFKLLGLSLNITRQGILSAGFFFIRVLTSVSLCVLLVLTTRHYVLLKALRVFGVPQIFVMTLGMCYRYIYLFLEIIQNTYLAIKSRVQFVSSLKSGQGIVAWNIAGLWQRSYAMHNEVYAAMLSRGYSGEPRVMDEFRTTFKDWLCLGIAALIFILSLWQKQYLH